MASIDDDDDLPWFLKKEGLRIPEFLSKESVDFPEFSKAGEDFLRQDDIIRFKASFLRVLLSFCGGRRSRKLDDLLIQICGGGRSRNLDDLLIQIRTQFQDVDNYLHPQSSPIDYRRFPFVRAQPILLMDTVVEKLEILNPVVQQVYDKLSKSSSSRSKIIPTGISHEVVMECFNSLLKNIKDMMRCKPNLIAPVREELQAAQTSLRTLGNFVGFTAKRFSKELIGTLKDVVNHSVCVLRKMSCLFFLCSVIDKMSDQMLNKLKMNLSSELHKFSAAHSEVRKMYAKALKASRGAQGVSPVVDESDLDFLDSLRDNILGSDRDQILSLHQDVRILTISFALCKSSEASSAYFPHIEPGIPRLDQISNYFLELSTNVIIDLGCLVYSLHCNNQNTEEARELKKAVSDLQDTLKIAKEDARKAYDMYIPRFWQPKTKYRTTNARGIKRSLMRIVEQIRSYSSNSGFMPQDLDLLLVPHGLPCHPSKVLQNEMKSLIIAFCESTINQDFEHGECEIQMTSLNDIRNKIENLISSVSQRLGDVWIYNLWLFILIDETKMLRMEIEDLQSQMMPDISARKLVFEDEAERIGKQHINGFKRPHSLPMNVGMHGTEVQDSDSDLICPPKDEVRAPRLKAGFLKVFLSCKGEWDNEHGKLEVLLTRISSVFGSADHDLQMFLSDLNDLISPKKGCYRPMDIDCVVSSVLSKASSRFSASISDEALMENLNTLLENIDALLKCNAELVAYLEEELEGVQNRLRLLRNFIGFTVKRCSKLGKLKDLLVHSEFLAGYISCLLYLCCENERMNGQIMNEVKIHLLLVLQMFSPSQDDVRMTYIKALKASKSAEGNSAMLDEFDLGFVDSLQDDILKLSNSNISSITSYGDQASSLQEEVKYFIIFFAVDRSLEEYSEHDSISNYVFECINAVIIDLGCLIYSLNDDEENEKMARELNGRVWDLVASIMDVKETTRKMYDLCVPKLLQSDFPRTNGQGFVDSLLWKLKGLLNTKADVAAPLEHHIGIVQKELLSLREDFGKIAKQPSQFEEFQSQWTQFLDIAYQTEYIVDSFLVKARPLFYHKLGLFNVVEDIKRIGRELKAFDIKATDEISVPKPSNQVSLESNFPKNNAVPSSKERLVDENSEAKLVIFREEADKIGVQLTNGSRNLNISSIVGMPGIGKTTLAESVFQHSSVTCHFHVRAECSVSQVYDKNRLLLEILQQVPDDCKQYSYADGDENLDQRLYQCLKGRRYLILLDDVWNIRPWKDIKASFPDDQNGSRIIFTSRFEDIATQAGLESIKYHLSPLSEEKSWEILRVKLFGNKICPPELASVGREIAANCKGLPLTVDLIAGFLRVKEINTWKEVAESLMTLVLEDPEGRCKKVLELSYQTLPDDLKPCFLYFAAFPEDAYVLTRDLILLWIAEGYIQLEEGELRSLEYVAEDILNNLISRSLVTVSRRNPFGGVVLSRVHDLLHEFAVAKAQEESFMLKVDGKPMFSVVSSVGVHDQCQDQYRLCIYPNNWGQFLESNPSGPRTRVLISSGAPFGNTFSLNFGAFKLLRVLYIPNVRCCYYPEMFTLIHLKVLAIDTFEDSDALIILSKIHELQNLESFIMERAQSRKSHAYLLLDKFCTMVRLRHFCFGGYISFRYENDKIWEMSSLCGNLQTLYHLRASDEEEIEKILKLMPNLVELKFIFYSPDGDIYPFPKLDFLRELESLDVTHKGNDSFQPCNIININFPPYLKKLVLSEFCVSWTKISMIANLQYLEVLELKNGAFRGPIWEMIDGQFPKLKYLSLYNLDIREWNASEDHLSCLEQLCVGRCKNLEELPSCLGEVAMLQIIRLLDCGLSVEKSAKRIKKDQEETRNEQLVVEIY